MASADPVVAERFRLGQLIGAGSLSEVYAAIDAVTGEEVAVKLASDRLELGEARLRFEREAAALAVLGSEHVVRLVAAGEVERERRPYLVLERLRGRNLQETLAAAPLAPADVARWLGQAAAALELAHGLGIVHRDLKPANLFLHESAGGRRVKVLDFGLLADTSTTADRGRDGFVGTPLYMAPEQVRGQVTRIGPATDVWAIGILSITLLTGEAYWIGATTEEVIGEIESSPIYPPSARWPWLPPAFDRWFARSVHRVAEKRFRSAVEQARQLTEALDGLAVGAAGVAGAALGAASTVAVRTPTPTVIRLSGNDARPLMGRQVEQLELERLLEEPAALVTLTGPAGVGKTRLAELMSARLGDHRADGAWLVSAAAADGADELAEAIALVLGVEADTTRSCLAQVSEALATRRALLVLDGVEAVDGAAAVVAALRAACPQLGLLVTSRLPLGLPGEHRMNLEPLDVPATAASMSVGEAMTYAAVELFVSRARLLDPSFLFDAEAVGPVVEICRLVDGLPLGIELAAAQVRARDLAAIRDHLAEGSSARAGGRAAGPTRAAAEVDGAGERLQRAVATSYELARPAEQALLRHLAVFPAGITFKDVAARFRHVTSNPAGAVLRLVEGNLLQWSTGTSRRLQMLETVRDWCRRAAERLGEEEVVWRVAYGHAIEVASWSDADDDGREQDEWLELLDEEHDNLHAVLTHALAHAPADALRLAGKLAWYWYLRGHYADGERWLRAALAHPGAAPAERMRALHGAGRLALLRCDYGRAAELLREARQLAVELDDARGEAGALQLLGSVARERGEYADARTLHQRSLTLWEALDDRREMVRAQNYLVFAGWLGDPAGNPADPEQGRWRAQALAELEALGDREGAVWALLNEGAIAHYQDDRERARQVLGLAFAEAIAARFQEGIAWSLELVGRASFTRGEYLQARAQLYASLRVHRRLGDLWRCASVLEALAAVAVATERPARGALYLGAADGVRERIGAPVPACERALLDAAARVGEDELGDAFATGRERGRRTALDDVVALAAELL